jgi:hypothetical protein
VALEAKPSAPIVHAEELAVLVLVAVTEVAGYASDCAVLSKRQIGRRLLRILDSDRMRDRPIVMATEALGVYVALHIPAGQMTGD